MCPGNETSIGNRIKETSESCISASLDLEWRQSLVRAVCCRRGRMDEDWVTSSKTNMYLGSGFDAAERRRHEFAVVDELSHQTYDHIVAVVEALSPLSKPPIFEAPNVVAITDVETPILTRLRRVFNSLSANLARGYREAALAIDKVSGVLD